MKKLLFFIATTLMSVSMFSNVATPVISGSTEFTDSTTVTITCSTDETKIFYTLDGSDPRLEGADEYTDSLTLKETTTIRAAAHDGEEWSTVAEKTFTFIDWTEILFDHNVSAVDLPNDAVFEYKGLKVAITDSENKMSIDANKAFFGTADEYVQYDFRLRTGGKSRNDIRKNYMTIIVPKAGELRIAVRTASISDETRTLVLVQEGDTIYNQIVKDTDAIEVAIDDSTKVKVFPYVTVPVKAGEIAVGYPVGAINFYEFGFGGHDVKSINYSYDSTKGSVIGASWAYVNSTITFSAVPNYGYNFTQWSDGNTDNPRTIVVTQDTTFTAEFAKNEYTITTQVNNSEWGTTAGDTIVLYGENVEISATSHEGYHFVRWSENEAIGPMFQVISPTMALEIASSLEMGEYSSETYTINGYVVGVYTASSNSYYIADTHDGIGILVAFRVNQTLSIGDHVAITGALHKYDETLREIYYGDARIIMDDQTSNEDAPEKVQTIRVTRNCTYTAIFEKDKHVITKNCDYNMGFISGNTQAGYMEEVALEAHPKYGYHFVQWNDGVVDNPRTFTLIQDTAFTAEFAKNKYTISAVPSNEERGITSGDTSALYLDSVEISAHANYGYHFAYWNPNPNVITVAEAVQIASSLPANRPTNKLFTIKGYIVGTYHAVNAYYIADTPYDTGVLVLYKPSNYVSIGDKVCATGSLCNYNGIVPEIYNGASVQTIFDYYTEPSDMYAQENTIRVESSINRTYTAVFAKNIYSITKIANERGYISGYSQAGYLDSVTLEAIPNNGYHFTQWSDGETDNPRMVQITQDTTFTAEFGTDSTGTCGKDFALTWAYDRATKTLTISGEGEFTENMQCGVEAKENMKHLVVEEGVTAVGRRAFQYCDNLVSINIAASVVSIYPGVILESKNITKVVAPATIFYTNNESDWSGFTKRLDSVVINGGELTEDIASVIRLSYKTLQTLDVYAITNTSLPDEAFSGCYNLQKLVLPENLKEISYMAIAGCINLKSITIPASVTFIDQRALEDCRSLSTLTFEEGSQLTTIDSWAFYNCHELAKIVLPEGVEEIGKAAFYGCAYAQEVHLPASVIVIGDNGFALCSKIKQMNVDAILPPDVEDKTFYEVSTEAPVYVPDESVDTYKSHAVWGKLNIQGRADAPTAVENTAVSEKATKILRNGQILIQRGEKTYTITGQEVR